MGSKIRYCKRIVLYSILNILSILILTSFQWPVEIRIITATFGEHRWGHFHSGIDIGGGEQPVLSADDGEVVFFFEEGEPHNAIPTGLGNFMVLAHGRGLRTLYAHLKAGTINLSGYAVEEGEMIGISGDSGGSLGIHLHFEVLDTELNRMVNPLLLLPPIPDKDPPVIQDAYLQKDSVMVALSSAKSVVPGTVRIALAVYDPCNAVGYFCPTAPFEVDAFIDGKRISQLKFEAINSLKGRETLNGEESRYFESLYPEEWIIDIGEVVLTEGTSLIEIFARDFSGNEVARFFEISVKE